MRNKRIDIIKGITITLVVMGHSFVPFLNFISLFHVSIFFIISGFLWNSKKINNFEDFLNYLKKKIKTLYVPFIIANLIFLWLNNLFIKLNIYKNNIKFLSYANSGLLITRFTSLKEILNLREIFISSIKILLFVGDTQLGGGTWFLRVLFIVSIGHALLELLFKKHKLYIYLFISLLSLITIQILINNSISLPYNLENIFLAYPCYTFGILLNHLKIFDFKIFKNKFYSLLLLIISLSIMLLLSKNFMLSFVSCNIKNILFFIVATFLGTIFILSLSNLIKYTQNIFIYIGKHTMPILLLHLISFKIVTFIFLICNNYPKYLLAAFPCLTIKYSWILYSIIGVIIPLMVYYFYNIIKKRCNHG